MPGRDLTIVSRTLVLMLVAAATLAAPRGASSAPEPPWTPEGPADCQHYVAEYNALTPQIEAAAAARDTAKKNDLTKERSARKRAFQNCVQGYAQMKPLGPAKLDPREQPAQTPPPTWTDAHGDTHPMSNRFVYTTPEGRRLAFPRTIVFVGQRYTLDEKSILYKGSAGGLWNAEADYRNAAGDRTTRHGTLVQ